MHWPTRWNEIRGRMSGGYAGERIVAELEYLARLPVADPTARDEAVEGAANQLVSVIADAATFGRDEALRIEEGLAPFGDEAKAITLHCVGHAHLDMNWMWGFDETAVIVLETMRTVLRLLEEYPVVRFSQSQASVYRIIETYEPELLPIIRRYVDEGRWELAATQWTETDMNLPSAESLVRHGLYTITYLQSLFGVDGDSLRVVFMPDTFGHSVDTPEILASAGVQYLYHGRGSAGPFLSRWIAPSGRSVLAYQDPRWYNETAGPVLFGHAAKLAESVGLKDVLSVYGVGDHGGGPTRRDLNSLIDMQSWPVAPRIRFSTYHEFFRSIESTDGIPEVRGERNPIFTGCYSSQSEIKSGNRRSERGLFVSEALGVLSGTSLPGAGGDPSDTYSPRRNQRFQAAWERVLFNHFHDILPGSGVGATRDYAKALYQEVHAETQISTNRSLRAIADSLAPAVAEAVARLAAKESLDSVDLATDRSEGAGVGFDVAADRAASTGRWGGLIRPILAVNPLPTDRTDLVELTIWDYPDVPFKVLSSDGEELPHQVVRHGEDPYWAHRFTVLLVSLPLAAWGHRILFVVPVESIGAPDPFHPYGVDYWLVEPVRELVLDNGLVRIEIDPRTLRIRSIRDAAGSGRSVVGTAGAGFSFEYEEPGRMTAWLTRRISRSEALGSGGRVVSTHIDPKSLRQWVELELPFGSSSVTARLELDAGSKYLRIRGTTKFRELYSKEWGTPRLVFDVEPAGTISSTRRDAPLTTVAGEPDGLPQAAQSFFQVQAATDEGTTSRLVLVGRDTQSFAAEVDRVSAILLRGSGDPDATPEIGDHVQVLYLTIGEKESEDLDTGDLQTLLTESLTSSVERPRQRDQGNGTEQVAFDGRLADVETDNLRILALKAAESQESAVVLRCVASEGAVGHLRFGLHQPAERRIAKAVAVDASESGSDSSVSVSVDSAGIVTADVPAGRLATVLVHFSELS